MASVQAVSNSILLKSFKESIPIPVTPMKLQKLVYFTYRNYLQKIDKRAFNDAIQTWKYGPVVQSVYDEFKSFGRKPISRFARDAQGKVYIVSAKDFELNNVIDNVWDKYKCYSGIDLSKMTHKDGTAWSKAYQRGDPFLDDGDIKNECIDGEAET